ncbi:MAG: hypothetical protein ACSLFN_05305 [Candidatus Limnocylindrales bacterium]
MKAVIVTLAFVLAACGSAATTTPPSVAPASSAPSAAGPAILPIIVSSEITKGPNRWLFSLTDPANNLIAAPDVAVHLEFYDVAAAEDSVAFEADARFLWAIDGERGLYAADIQYPKAGRWGTRFTATLPDGATQTVRADYDVTETGRTPAIGAAAPSVDTPTLADVDGEVAKVSTDKAPEERFYQTSVADALAAKQPFVLVFATPAFCQTAVCGPTLEVVKGVAADFPTVTFINVEPYKMVFTDGRLQPELSADGQLQTAPWTDAFGLPSEPWVFVVDAAGKVTEKFETILAAEEMRAAIDTIAPTSAAGIVTAVDQSSLTDVRGFTLRTTAGTEMTFSIGDLELTDGAFPANHLREHMATATRVNVAFEIAGDQRLAVRLTDAE